MILPDSSLLAYYVLRTADRLVAGLQVVPERMLANLWSSHGLVFSQPVLLALVAGGLSRDAAYRIVQEDAMRAWDEGVSFRSLLEKDERVTIGAGRARRGLLTRAVPTPHRRGLRRAGRGRDAGRRARLMDGPGSRSSTGARCGTSTTPATGAC